MIFNISKVEHPTISAWQRRGPNFWNSSFWSNFWNSSSYLLLSATSVFRKHYVNATGLEFWPLPSLAVIVEMLKSMIPFRMGEVWKLSGNRNSQCPTAEGGQVEEPVWATLAGSRVNNMHLTSQHSAPVMYPSEVHDCVHHKTYKKVPKSIFCK